MLFKSKLDNYKCRCKCKIHHICERDYTCNPATCSCKNGKDLEKTNHDSEITCDEITKETFQ